MKEALIYAVATPLGEMHVHVLNGIPILLTLPGGCRNAKQQSPPSPATVSRLREALEAYFRGEEISMRYTEVLIARICRTPFEEAVLKEVAHIPRGEVRSYGEVARFAGYPRAARAVGNVMHDNPFPIIIPCHRVIRKDGCIGGYGGAESIKAWLLDFEVRGQVPGYRR